MKYSSVVRRDRLNIACEIYPLLSIHKKEEGEEYKAYPMKFYTEEITKIVEDHSILKYIDDKKNIARSLFDINYKDFKRFSVDKTTKPATYKCIEPVEIGLTN